jgi:hypothetical protein
MIKLFVGLGNPGPEYEATRHNAGFWWIDALAREFKVTLAPDKAFPWPRGPRDQRHGHTLWLLQPQTFMNLSGKSVAALARFFKILPEEILVAHDELDIVPRAGQAEIRRQSRGPQRPARHSRPARHGGLLALAPGRRPSGREGRGDQLGPQEAVCRNSAKPSRPASSARCTGGAGLDGRRDGKSHAADPHGHAPAPKATSARMRTCAPD